MDIGSVLTRAWEITWRWKVLWILGFLAILSDLMAQGGNLMPQQRYEMNLEPWFQDAPPWAALQAIPAILGIVLGLFCLGLLIAIALWVISVIARGGLVAAVEQVEDEGATSFAQAWRGGAERVWTLLGISLLASIPIFVLLFLGFLGVIVATLGAVRGFELSDAAGGMAVVTILGIACGTCCLLIPLAIVLEQIRLYAERAAVLEGMGWLDAFKRGWQVIKENLGATIILWLIFFGLSLAVGAVIFMGGLVLVVPFVPLFAQGGPTLWLVPPLCLGGLLLTAVFGLIGAVMQTFTSSAWTLAYREMTE